MFVAHRDASEPAHNRQLAHWLHNHLPAVAVFGHAAGLLGFDLIPDLTPQQFARIVSPKVCDSLFAVARCIVGSKSRATF